MPEGPEVRRLCMELNEIIGKGLLISKTDIEGIDPRIPIRLGQCYTKGKHLFFKLSDTRIIHSHLGMTGDWTFTDHGSTSLRHIIEFVSPNPLALRYYDRLNLGTVTVMTEQEANEIAQSIGPDIFSVQFTYEAFREAMAKGNIKICDKLVDQERISGIGNYLRSEILYEARISPFKHNLTDVEYRALYEAIKKVSREFFENPNRKFKVYDQTKDPEGNVVSDRKVRSRRIYYVMKYQI